MRLAALAALVLALVVVASAAGSPPSESTIETLLVCPTCHTTLDESNAPAAEQMKEEIRRRIAQGWTQKQILDEMVANYGPSILSTPATHGFDLVAWVLPIGGIAGGALGLGFGAWYWARPRRSDELAPVAAGGPPLDPELERRVDEELERFDG